jgi:hypothetical protein
MAGRSAFLPWTLVWSFKFQYEWLKVRLSIPSYIHPSMIYTMVEIPLSFHGYLYDHSGSTMNGWRFIVPSHPISIHPSFIQWQRFRFHSMDTCMIIQVLLGMVEGSSFHPILYPSIHHLYNGGRSAFFPWILVWSFKFYYAWLKVHHSIPSYIHPSMIYTMAGRSAFPPWILVWSFKFHYEWLKVHLSIPSYIHPSMIYTMVEGPLSFHGYLYDHSSSTMNGWRFIIPSHPISIHPSFMW